MIKIFLVLAFYWKTFDETKNNQVKQMIYVEKITFKRHLLNVQDGDFDETDEIEEDEREKF